MSYPRTFLFGERPDITDTIPPGMAALWVNSSALKIRFGTTTLTLATGITLEQVQDLLANSFADTSSITWVYDDNANVFRASIATSVLSTINSALQPGANISELNNNAGFEATAQLNARDAANRNRANHSGTQLANTISNLKQFIDNYLDRNYNQNDNESVNTTTNFEDRFNFNFTPKNSAVYEFKLNLAHSHDSNQSNMELEFLIDGTPVDDSEFEPQDSGGSEGNSGTDQKFKTELRYLTALTANVSVNLQCRYRTETGGVEAAVKNHRFSWERWMP